METILEKIHILLTFNNQQVVINFYEDEELIQREGLYFESIQITDYQLRFNKDGCTLFSLQLNEYNMFSQRAEFKNYFLLEAGENRVELYFP